jgi:hypothetical protein
MGKVEEIKRRGDQELDLVETVVKEGELFSFYVVTAAIRDSLFMIQAVSEELSKMDIRDEPEKFGDKVGESFEYVAAIMHFSEPLKDKRMNRVLKKAEKRMFDIFKLGFTAVRYNRYICEVEKLLAMTRKYTEISTDAKVKLLERA